MSDTVGEILATLQEMGFTEAKAKKALTKTGWKGVEPAMEWLLAHGDDVSDDDKDEEEGMEDDAPVEAPKKELTEEERKAQLERLEELRVKKRAEREAREAKETLEREKRMREEGRAMTQIKKDYADMEIRRAAEERRREKLETLKAKERVKAQIEADRKARREEEARRRGEAVPEAKPAAAAVAAAAPAEKKDYEETRLQIRLTNGSALVNTFKVKETLGAVRLYVELNRKDGIPGPPKFMTNFPKKTFEEDDYQKPLSALGLVPSAVLIVTK